MITASRIALCLPLLLVDVMTVPFWVLYVIAGTTDMLDGFLARRWGVESKFGARLDSLADFVFVIVVGYKLFPWLKLPATLWMMIGFIALVKVSNAMRTTVAGTILEKAGTVSDALGKIPSLEAERDGGVKVLERGDAEAYINVRKVHDMK